MLTNSGALITTSPGKLLLSWGKEGDASRFYFPDFFLKNHSWFSFEEEKTLPYDQLISLCEGPAQKVAWQEPLPFDFRKAKALIDKGKLKKAVPYTFCHTKTQMNPQLFKHILKNLGLFARKNNAYLYGFWNEEEGMLGASPELLFELQGNQLKTAAVAGTSKSEEHLKTCQKEQLEHALVVEGIEESLSEFGKVKIQKQQIVPFGSFFHLVTPIEMHLKRDVSFSTIVSALHPTPALGAYPRKEGGKWLSDYQTFIPRKRFGAPVGYCDKEIALAYVAIRNVQWDKNGLAIGAGCGVVKTSNEEKEWKEVQLKISATKQIMGL